MLPENYFAEFIRSRSYGLTNVISIAWNPINKFTTPLPYLTYNYNYICICTTFGLWLHNNNYI